MTRVFIGSSQDHYDSAYVEVVASTLEVAKMLTEAHTLRHRDGRVQTVEAWATWQERYGEQHDVLAPEGTVAAWVATYGHGELTIVEVEVAEP